MKLHAFRNFKLISFQCCKCIIVQTSLTAVLLFWHDMFSVICYFSFVAIWLAVILRKTQKTQVAVLTWFYKQWHDIFIKVPKSSKHEVTFTCTIFMIQNSLIFCMHCTWPQYFSFYFCVVWDHYYDTVCLKSSISCW